jgi:hypothetical protein
MNASGFGARDSRNRLTHPSTSELRLRTLPFSALAFGQSLESDSSALATSALGRLPGAFKETVKGSILTFPIRYRTLPYHRGTSGERTYVQSNVNLTKVANLGPSAPRHSSARALGLHFRLSIASATPRLFLTRFLLTRFSALFSVLSLCTYHGIQTVPSLSIHSAVDDACARSLRPLIPALPDRLGNASPVHAPSFVASAFCLTWTRTCQGFPFSCVATAPFVFLCS